MCKDTTKIEVRQEKNLFSFSNVLTEKKIQVDFNAPDISSNGELVLVGLMKGSKAFARYRDIDEDMKKELGNLLD